MNGRQAREIRRLLVPWQRRYADDVLGLQALRLHYRRMKRRRVRGLLVICKSCAGNQHGLCKGLGWCDCQHRDQNRSPKPAPSPDKIDKPSE